MNTASPFPRGAVVLTATGALWALASAISPDIGLRAADRYSRVAAHQTLEGLAGLLFMVVAALFVLSAMTVVAARVTGRGARVAGVGGVLIGLGATWMAVCYPKFHMVFLQLLQEKVPASYADRIIDGGADPWENWFDLALLCVLVGPAVLAVGLRRAGRVGWLPLVLWVVGVLIYASIDFVSVPGRVASLVVCAVGLALMGRGLDRDSTRAESGAPAPAAEAVRPS